MLRRVNTALFRAPRGAAIQVVVESQGNNGVNAARFEYGQQILPGEMILGLPGCSFTVANTRKRLQAGVVFDPGASGSARYDLFEVENGVKSALDKFARHSEATPQIAFAIDPVPVEAVAPVGPVGAAPGRRAVRKKARKQARKRKTPKKKKKKKTAKGRKTTRKRRTSRMRTK